VIPLLLGCPPPFSQKKPQKPNFGTFYLGGKKNFSHLFRGKRGIWPPLEKFRGKGPKGPPWVKFLLFSPGDFQPNLGEGAGKPWLNLGGSPGKTPGWN